MPEPMPPRPRGSLDALRHAAERLGVDRRRFLRDMGRLAAQTAVGGSLASLVLTACNSSGPSSARGLLRLADATNESVERWLFRHTSMNDGAPGSSLAGAGFPSYFISKQVPTWDAAVRGEWTLEVGGMVRRPVRLTLAALQRLPRVTQRVDHFCVEGWVAAAERSGVRVSELARLVQPLAGAEYVDFGGFDDGFHESWDLDSALHPQTIVAYGQDGHLLTPAYGAPARVHSPIKLGYKNAKYLTRVTFLPARNGGYWSDKGYEWYGGV